VKLAITTTDAPVGTELAGTITGLCPGGLVQATSRLVDVQGEAWTASAMLAADGAGMIDLETAPSLSGTYTGVDALGLFWSAQPVSAETRLIDILARRVEGGLAPALETLADLKFQFSFSDTATGETAIQAVTRRRLPENVRRSDLPAPLCGLLFEPESPNGAGIIVLGGSEGGVFPARAALLAAHGFTTLSLAYFAYPGRPDAAVDLPIEYFVSAIERLRAQPGIDRVGIIGVSRGSEAAQLVALARPKLLDCLIAWVPSHLVHRAIDLQGGQDFMTETRAMWSEAGRAVDGIGFGRDDIEANLARIPDFNTPAGRRYREVFGRAWRRAEAENARIPIERYGGPVLAIGGHDDALWPSDDGAKRIVEAAQTSNASSRLLNCPSAGHLIGTPGDPRPFPYVMHWAGGYMGIDNGFCAYGGTPEGAALAARVSWKEALDFLHAHLRG